METRTEEAAVGVVPNQFWGAIKIFTEKPHVINRRICGTTNLWVGVCEERNYSRDKVLTSVLNVIDRESNDKETREKNSDYNINSEADHENKNRSEKLSLSDTEEREMQESLRENNLDEDFEPETDYKNVYISKESIASDQKENETQNPRLEINTENHIHFKVDYDNTDKGRELNADINLTNFNHIRKTLKDNHFKPFSDYDVKAENACEASENDNNDASNDNGSDVTIETDHVTNNLKDNCEATKRDDSADDDDDDEDESATETGRQNASPDCRKEKLSIPWGYLTKASNTVAVVRKVLPKQADKFASVLEVILLGMYCENFL